MKYRYGIGVMSKNIVDECINYANNFNVNIAFIPSRRQVDNDGGYVNNWTTETFSYYVRSKTSNIILKRDHGGPHQGKCIDDGIVSLYNDCIYFDSIHIDPWKIANNFYDGCLLTKDLIKFCHNKNKNIWFEIGTEQSIFHYESDQLYDLISYLKNNLSSGEYEQIKYGVIQSGTSLKENKNTGSYNNQRLVDMVSICKKFGLLSKEHNGDYLPLQLIEEKFYYGLDAINIAPEFGQIETKTYLDEVRYSSLFETFFDICYSSKKWEKWVDKSFNPFINKERLINICGHYVLSTDRFVNEIKNQVRYDIDNLIRDNIRNKLNELYKTKNDIL